MRLPMVVVMMVLMELLMVLMLLMVVLGRRCRVLAAIAVVGASILSRNAL